MTSEELQEEIKRLEEQLTKLRFKISKSKVDDNPYKVEMPKDIDNYVYINNIGNIYDLNTFTIVEFEKIYKRGLAFKTKKEAEQYDRERILLFKLHKWAEEHNGGWTPHENNTVNFYIIYRNSDKTLDVNLCSGIRKFSKLPYFKSEEIAGQFIEEFGDEIKEVLC